MEIDAFPEPDYAAAQRDVQRWLGRCLLSLQQSERLLKALLHDSAVDAVHSGRIGEGERAFEVNRRYGPERLRTMTMGALVKAFLGDVAQQDAAPQTEADLPADRLSVRMRMGLSLDLPAMAALESKMRAMVSLRNELVHHLVERFELWSVAGCDDALRHLRNGFEQAERFRQELLDIAKGMAAASHEAAAFISSPAGLAFLQTGRITLSGMPVLDALAACWLDCEKSPDGSVALSALLSLLQVRFPHETPERYARSSWPQLIHESRAFAIIRHGPGGARVPPRVRWLGMAQDDTQVQSREVR